MVDWRSKIAFRIIFAPFVIILALLGLISSCRPELEGLPTLRVMEITREYGPGSPFTGFKYDKEGRLISVEDYYPPEHIITNYYYDSLNTIVRSVLTSSSLLSGDSKRTVFHYFWTDRYMEKVEYAVIGEDDLQERAKYYHTYNSNNEMVRVDAFYIDYEGNNHFVFYYTFQWFEGNLIKAELWANNSGNYGIDKTKRISGIEMSSIHQSPCNFTYEELSSNRSSRSFDLISIETFDYDSGINPMHFLSTRSALYPHDMRQNVSKNNCVKAVYKQMTSHYSEESDTRYEYNSVNYPIKSITNWKTVVFEEVLESSYLRCYHYSALPWW
jgi:hypothetical protein